MSHNLGPQGQKFPTTTRGYPGTRVPGYRGGRKVSSHTEARISSPLRHRTGKGVGSYPLYQYPMPSQRFSPKVDSTRLTVNLFSACSRRKNNLQRSSGFRIKADGGLTEFPENSDDTYPGTPGYPGWGTL
eukprot:3799137-Rhodomonas_salina.1